MLQIVLPLSFILSSIHVFVNSKAICLVICPEPIINVSVYVDESTFAVSSVLPPLSDVLGSVRPGLFSKTIPEASFPLACIDSSCAEFVG